MAVLNVTVAKLVRKDGRECIGTGRQRRLMAQRVGDRRIVVVPGPRRVRGVRAPSADDDVRRLGQRNVQPLRDGGQPRSRRVRGCSATRSRRPSPRRRSAACPRPGDGRCRGSRGPDFPTTGPDARCSATAPATSRGLVLGRASSSSATAPATCGDAIDVPLRFPYPPCSSGSVDRIVPPGAPMSGLKLRSGGRP